MGLCLLPLAKSCAYCRGLFVPGRARTRLKQFNRRGATRSAAAICLGEKPPRSGSRALAAQFKWPNTHRYAQSYTLQEAVHCPLGVPARSGGGGGVEGRRVTTCVCLLCAAAALKGTSIQDESKFVTVILPEPVKRRRRPEALSRAPLPVGSTQS